MSRPASALCILVLAFCSARSNAELLSVAFKSCCELRMQVDTFNPKKHTLKKCGDYLCLIDGTPFFGSDGKLPSQKMFALEVVFKGNVINLDVSSMYNPNVTRENIAYRLKAAHHWGDFYKITGRFSDGAGAYIAEWLVSPSGAIRTHIGGMEDLYGLYKAATESISQRQP